MLNLDIEDQIDRLEETVFSYADICIQKKKEVPYEGALLYLGKERSDLYAFYEQLDRTRLRDFSLGMYSSGTTKGSQSLCLRSKASILEEVLEMEHHLQGLHAKKILILVTPNHSFGLIPGLLVSRRLSNAVYFNAGNSPLEAVKQVFSLEPEILFSVPVHLRLLKEWVQKKGKSLSFLKQIIYAGSILDRELIAFFHAAEISLTSLYGTTQTGVIAIQKNVSPSRPDHSGKILNTLSVSLSKERREIVVTTSDGKKVSTGDEGAFVEGNLKVGRRLDAVVFINGSKVDLEWLQSAIQKALGVEAVQIRFEKNINNQSEITCLLPKACESKDSFEKIKQLLPPYAIPKRIHYV